MGWVQCVKGSAHTGPALTPAEVLIALHGIDPHRDSVSLKKVSSILIFSLIAYVGFHTVFGNLYDILEQM